MVSGSAHISQGEAGVNCIDLNCREWGAEQTTSQGDSSEQFGVVLNRGGATTVYGSNWRKGQTLFDDPSDYTVLILLRKRTSRGGASPIRFVCIPVEVI
jgi:hypothetical protein